MSAICGYFDLGGGKRVGEDVLGAMLRTMSHRASGGSRTHVEDGIALGINYREEANSGMEPLWNEDRSVVMVCSGTIFNGAELKADLQVKGHTFRTDADIEVLLHLYEERGTDFGVDVNGQFAVALYDARQKRLLLVRDHVGICPMFYAVVDGTLVFASEIKAILGYPGAPRKLNLKAVDHLMNFPGVVSPETFFEGIRSLRSGHALQAIPGREVEDLEYWDMIYPTEEEDKGKDYYIEGLRDRLKSAIEKRLVADIPVGFYISGGLDSSAVASFIGHYGLNSQYSFAAKIGDGELDESRFQKIVLERVKTNHFNTEVAEAEIWANLYDVIWHAESAVKESYDVAAYMLSALAQKSPAKIVLTGQGSDEFLCGYVGYTLDQFRAMQKGLMTAEECELNERLWGDPYFRYERNHPEIRKMHRQVYSDALRGEIDKFSALATSPINVERVKGLTSQKRRSYIDSKLRLADHLLVEHGDHMAYAHGVEGRHPFLDRDVLNFIAQMPDKYKLNGTNEKFILKKASEGIVPPEVLKRKKFPFQAPGMSALVKQSGGDLRFLEEDLLKKYGIFDVEFVNEMKRIYSQSDFKLMGAYEIDYLLIVMTVTMLCERYGLSV